MPSTVIVALPEDYEPVWNLSSEKKPHLTILYLSGSLDTNEQEIIEFVKHAADTSLSCFGLSVDRRGILGDEEADVLFFETEFAQDIRNFRAQLLKNEEIAKSYVKEDQFPGWIPHLTMGYPAAPAKEPDQDHRHSLNWINFDRIAVWTSDFDGPEFDLKSHDMSTDVGAWSEEHGVHIMHYGKKGMRWGVRTDPVSGSGFRGTGMARTSGNLSKKEGTDLSKLVMNSHTYSKAAAPKVKADLDAINKSYTGKDLNKDSVYAKYRSDTRKMYEKHLLSELPEGLTGKIMSHPNLDYPGYVVIGNKSGVDKEVKLLEGEGFKHDDLSNVGRFALTEIVKDRLTISMNLGEEVEISHSLTDEESLAHYGKLGMRWGVRRPTGPGGLVKGTVAGAIKSGQKPHTEEALAGVRKGKGKKQSSDHKQMVKNLDKSVESLSTSDIKQITARVKAVNEFKATTKAQKDAKASTVKKLTDFALKSVKAGVQKKADAYIQEVTGDVLDGILPKTKAQKSKDEAKAKQQEAKSEGKKKTENPKDRDEAVNNLAKAIMGADGSYDVSSMPKNKED